MAKKCVNLFFYYTVPLPCCMFTIPALNIFEKADKMTISPAQGEIIDFKRMDLEALKSLRTPV